MNILLAADVDGAVGGINIWAKHIYDYSKGQDEINIDTAPDKRKDFTHFTSSSIKRILDGIHVYVRYVNGLSKIQKARNQAEHCVCSFSEDNLLEMYESAVPFVNDFFEEELEIDPATVFANWLDFLDIKKLAEARQKNVEEFIDEHTDIEALKRGEHITAECSECGAEAIDIGDGMLTCKACGNKEAYNTCSECGGIFPENGCVNFYDELGICGNCFDEKSGILDGE